ncbi:Capsular polysaccharide biosynthesis protein [Lachnospiraceae bacterium]|nr:Capsular polysaccharide biosynthesis protein [Lachnospiraceae bacterium]
MNLNEDIRFADFELSFIAVWKKKLIPLIVGTICFILGIVATMGHSVENLFRASATVYSAQVSSQGEKTLSIALPDYVDLANSSRVCERAAQMIPSYGLSASDVQAMVNVNTSSTGLIMSFYAMSTDAALAVDVSNAVAESFVIEMRSATGTNMVQMLDSAEYSSKTSDGLRALWKTRIVFFFAGFILAAFVIFVKELFSDKVRLIEQCALEDEDVILGVLPEVKDKK